MQVMGKGGMISKIEAAEICLKNKCEMVITSGDNKKPIRGLSKKKKINMVCKEMNKELSSLLNKMGQKAKIASSILNTASSDQKINFLIWLLNQFKKMLIQFLRLITDIQQAKENNKDAAFIDRSWMMKGF